MNEFHYQFTVKAPVAAVKAFHHDTRALKKLTPPPIFAQVHEFEPLAEGSKARFTLWFGPLPIHWEAVHHHVGFDGFSDKQVSGSLKYWDHTHRFTAVDASTTLVREHIKYSYPEGGRGLLSRALFNKIALTMLFTARKHLTRYHVSQQGGAPVSSH